MAWNCEQIEASLTDYIDRLLDAGERSAFDRHISTCPRCAPLVQRVSRLVAELHRLEPLEARPELVPAILEQTLGLREKKTGWRSLLGWSRAVWQPRFAYGAVSLLVTFGVLFQVLGIEWRKPALADLNPVNIYRAADRRAHLIYARGAKFVTDLRVVYEIQSRLRPEAEPPAPPEPKPGPGRTEGPPAKSPRQLNRANYSREFTALASMLATMPRRSVR